MSSLAHAEQYLIEEFSVNKKFVPDSSRCWNEMTGNKNGIIKIVIVNMLYHFLENKNNNKIIRTIIQVFNVKRVMGEVSSNLGVS